MQLKGRSLRSALFLCFEFNRLRSAGAAITPILVFARLVGVLNGRFMIPAAAGRDLHRRDTGNIVTGFAASRYSFEFVRARNGNGIISADPRLSFVLIVVRSSVLRALDAMRLY